MRTSRRVRSVTLVLVLIAALALWGSDPAEAKKKPKPPPEPEWVWEVQLPTTEAFNLLGGQSTYTDGGAGDGIWAEITASRQGRGALMSLFGFAVFKCEPGERCGQGGDLPQPPPVQLQGIELDGYSWRDDPGSPCVFPGFPNGCGVVPPGCMPCFLNGQHPYWDDSYPSYDYRYFSFEMTVPGDFEDIEPGDKVWTWGNLYINLFNTSETLLPPGEDDSHNIDGRVLLTEDAISITRDGENTWIVRVTVNPPMLFSEWYVGCFKGPNKKGNCPWVYKFPLDSWTSGPLNFEVTWTRTTQ